MDSLLLFIPVALLLLISAYFSCSETALTGFSQPRMLELERQGNKRAAILNRMRERKERMIGSLLVGNNVVNTANSALMTAMFIGWFGEAGLFYATAVASLLIIVFAEIMPKTYALYAPDRMALLLGPGMNAFSAVLTPLTAAIEAVVVAVFRLFGLNVQRGGAPVASEEELRGVISMRRGPEPEVAEERKMLFNVLDLADVSVERIMTHRSATSMVDGDKSAAVVIRQVLASPYSRLPVYRGSPDNIVGVIQAKDLLLALQRARGNPDLIEIAKVIREPWYIPESTSLLDQLRAFQRRREHFALVVDEYGSFQGVVTLEDILEEIVGDIQERHEQTASGIRPSGDGSYVVSGELAVRDLNRELGWSLPEEQAATVAGLVMHEAQRIPEVRQVFAFHGFRFEILRKKNNRIMAVRIAPLEPPAKSRAAEKPDKPA